ncbi:DUF3052 family protein [Pinirhizobacter sp.]|jgi:hypothetical protein|uniref:DUF3052 family protein n=1 Tax=Pinirhizobacter sp. TaxID=2950432 RepID=UPI002F3FA311
MSDKPVLERLQVKHGRSFAALNAPKNVEPALASAVRAGVDQADVVLLFVNGRAEFDTSLTAQLPRLRSTAILWVAYPKLTSRLAGDLSRDIIHTAAPAHGLDTVSQIAIDEDWSALRLKRV